MAQLVVKIPDDVKHKMESFSGVDWSRKLQDSVFEELKRQSLLKLAEKTFEKSRLSEEDALQLGEKVKESLHNAFKKKHPEEYK